MKEKNNRGEIMLESLIVYSITIFLLFFILAIFSVLFQHWNIQVIANESASRVAQTYRFTEADTVTGQIEKSKLTNIDIYRYFNNSSEMENSARTKIQEYAKDRLNKTTFTRNISDPIIDVNVVKDSSYRKHIEVKISGEYSVPFGEALSYFGFESTIKYETTAYAECLDLSNYINTTDYVKNQISLNKIDSSFVRAVNKILGLFKTLTSRK